MRIQVKFFAAPREALQREQVELELPSGVRVRELLERLSSEYPALRTYVGGIKVAVNHKYSALEDELHDGDEVACLPPVGGG
jgi:molybdopterin synthase sulfur carrier subunit